MRERTGIKFLDDLFALLNEAIDYGAEVHIVDHSDQDKVVEHVFNAEEGTSDDDLPFGDEDICPYDGSCDECPYEKECSADLDAMAECSGNCEYCCDNLYGTDPHMWGIPDIDRIVFSNPATIIFWDDGDKTVVKTCSGDKFERYAGFAMACMKKLFGSTSRAKAVMNQLAVDQPTKVKKEVPEDKPIEPGDLDETIKEAVNEALER